MFFILHVDHKLSTRENFQRKKWKMGAESMAQFNRKTNQNARPTYFPPLSCSSSSIWWFRRRGQKTDREGLWRRSFSENLREERKWTNYPESAPNLFLPLRRTFAIHLHSISSVYFERSPPILYRNRPLFLCIMKRTGPDGGKKFEEFMVLLRMIPSEFYGNALRICSEEEETNWFLRGKKLHVMDAWWGQRLGNSGLQAREIIDNGIDVMCWIV